MARTLFVTGTLAAEALEEVLRGLEDVVCWRIEVMPITVAALMTVEWIAERLSLPEECDLVVLPGLVRGDPAVLAERLGVPVERGPRDLKELPRRFGQRMELRGYGTYRTRIVAEITNAWTLDAAALLAAARVRAAAGADIIDLGGPPKEPYPRVGEAVSLLKREGFSVSVESLDPETLNEASRAGADLLLSVHAGTLDRISPDCPVVVIPEPETDMTSFHRCLERALARGLSVVADPVLDPLLFGFSESLVRFTEVRRRYPGMPLLMGVGNVTELVEADSVGINALLAGIAEELQVDYLLTVEEISWTAGSVRELDLARRLMHYAGRRRMLPKHLVGSLVVAKEIPFEDYTEEELRRIAARVRDKNFRIFVGEGRIHVFNGERFVSGTEAGELFPALGEVDAAHAFYLGRELERAETALRLGKHYVQEEPLRFGYRNDRHDP